MKYYVYKTTNIVNNKIYIGVHKSDDIQNDQYLGSGKYFQNSVNKYGKDKFKRQILYQFDTPEQAYQMQMLIVDKQFVKRKDTYNIRQGGLGGLAGIVVTKNENGSIFCVSIDDPRYLSGQLVHHTKYCVTVKDEHGNTFNVSKLDPRYLSGQLVHINKGRKLDRQKFPNHFKGKYNVGFNTMWVYNPSTFKNKRVSRQQEIPTGYLKGKFSKPSNKYLGCKQRKWITDGINNKRIFKYQEIPPGWKLGRIFRIKDIQKHNKNISISKMGTICINNGVVNKYIDQNQFCLYESKGWNKGMHKRKGSFT